MIPLAMKSVHKVRGSGPRASNVLKGVSLSVHPGEIVLLEGPSGSGKTTLLSVAAGLLLPDMGQVKINDISTTELSSSELRRLRLHNIGFVFQQSNLLSRLTVQQNIMLMATLTGLNKKEAEKETGELLYDLKLSKLVNRYPYELSGGEEQRVGVARALIHKPRIILADEPTGNLDKKSGKSVAEALASVVRTRDTSIIIASHDYRLKKIASRLIKIEDGLIFEG